MPNTYKNILHLAKYCYTLSTYEVDVINLIL